MKSVHTLMIGLVLIASGCSASSLLVHTLLGSSTITGLGDNIKIITDLMHMIGLMINS